MAVDQKVVLVTGANRGIGKAIALYFAKKGYIVGVNVCHHLEEAEDVKKMVESLGSRAIVLLCDVSVEEQVKTMVDKLYQECGRIDVLVNNAGIALDTTFEDKTVENFQKTLNVNLIGSFLVSKYVAEIMIKQETYGSIVQISSTNGIDTGYPEGLDYDASKAGVISLMKNLAVQYSPYIRINTIASGWVNTPMNQQLDRAFFEKEKRKILLGRFAEPEEIASVAYFLASEEASYIHGSVFRVDGGFYL